MKRAALRGEIPKMKPHQIRKAFSTLGAAVVEQGLVDRLTRHELQGMARIYVRASLDQMRAAMETISAEITRVAEERTTLIARVDESDLWGLVEAIGNNPKALKQLQKWFPDQPISRPEFKVIKRAEG